MVENPLSLMNEFIRAAGENLTGNISHEPQFAPHIAHKLPAGRCAVYVFSLSGQYGKDVVAGQNRVLKVGKAGFNSNARFQSQHYSPGSSGSSLADTLLRKRILWSYLGIADLSESNVRRWIEENTDRDNFYLSVSHEHLLGERETYLRGRLGPVFEGG